MEKLEAQLYGDNTWYPVPPGMAEEDAAFWLMRRHGGRIGSGVRPVAGLPGHYRPMARSNPAPRVHVRAIKDQ